MSLFSHARLVYRAYRYRWKNDPAEIAFLRTHVVAGTVALDVGAHKGGYTYWLARGVGARGHVHAFEPQPALALKLQEGFSPARVTVRNAGVSDRDGTMKLHIPTDGRPSPGASLEATGPAAATGHAIDVKVIALDPYLDGLRGGRPKRVSFLKCDVEGHELSVFRGAEQLLRRDRPVLLFECEQRHHGARPIAEVFAYLEGLGYRGQFFDDDRLRPLAEFNVSVHQRAPKEPGYCNNFVFSAA
ncbi:MAG TPA: FkbM family methyltransferase [Opitutaceae bacterium]|nr:FkbM family methyltransferase [Opitutaceae bacterium]